MNEAWTRPIYHDPSTDEQDLFVEGPKENICSLGDLDLRHCLHFNSSNKDYVSLPPLHSTHFDDITVTVWVKLFSYGTDPHCKVYLFDLRGDGRDSNQGLCLSLEQINGQTEAHYSFSYAPRKWTEICSVIPSPLNKWTHFAFVRQGSEFRTYINGEIIEEQKLRGSSTASSQPTPLALAGGRLGTASTASRSKPSCFLNGLLSEFCVWRRALTHSELKEQMWVLDRIHNAAASTSPSSAASSTGPVISRSSSSEMPISPPLSPSLPLSQLLSSDSLTPMSMPMTIMGEDLRAAGMAWYWPLSEGEGNPVEVLTGAEAAMFGASWAVSTISPPSYEETYNQPEGMMMCKSFVNNKQFSDVEFEVGGETVYAHRVVLAMHSPFFRAIFDGPWFESRRDNMGHGHSKIPLPDVPLNAFLFMLEWMYVGTGSIPVGDMSMVVEILQCADKFGVVGLKQKCVKLLKEGMTLDNVATLLELGTRLMLDSMVEACLSFIFTNWEVMKSDPALKNGILENVFHELEATFQTSKFY